MIPPRNCHMIEDSHCLWNIPGSVVVCVQKWWHASLVSWGYWLLLPERWEGHNSSIALCMTQVCGGEWPAAAKDLQRQGLNSDHTSQMECTSVGVSMVQLCKHETCLPQFSRCSMSQFLMLSMLRFLPDRLLQHPSFRWIQRHGEGRLPTNDRKGWQREYR